MAPTPASIEFYYGKLQQYIAPLTVDLIQFDWSKFQSSTAAIAEL